MPPTDDQETPVSVHKPHNQTSTTFRGRKPAVDETTLARWQRLVEWVADIIRMPAALITQVNPSRLTICAANRGPDSPYQVGQAVDPNTGRYCQAVMARRAPLSVPDARRDPAWASTPGADPGMVCYLGLPLQWPDGELFGTLCVLDRQGHPDLLRNQELLAHFSTVVEADLKLLLVGEQYRVANRRLNLIAKTATVVVGAAPLAEQAEELARQVRTVLDADACVIRVLENQDLTLLANVGVPVEDIHPRMDPSLGIAGEVIGHRRQIFIPDVRAHKVTAPVVDQLPHSYHFTSYAGVPLLVGNRAIGILGLFWKTECRHFGPDDLNHLQILADNIAVSIANARLHAQVEHQRDRLEADISERTRVEAALMASEAKYRRLHESMMDAFVSARISGRIQESNRAFREMLGYTEQELSQLTSADLTPTRWHAVEARIVREQVLKRGFSDVYEKEYQRKDGTVIPVELRTYLISDDRGRPSGMWAIVRDITDRKRAEEELLRHRDRLAELVEARTRELDHSRAQLRRTERLASIGTLAAGIAHEINNPLGMMMLSADLALGKTDQPDVVCELLHQLKNNITRCSQIVRDVLEFARDRSPRKGPVDLNGAVNRALDFTREYARQHGVAIDTRLGENIAPLLSQSTEIEQLVVNLVHNAVQACRGTGHVTLETRDNGNAAHLTVRDNGCGMGPEAIEHAFDPFFTTRLGQGGTGLGLSIVHGIVTSYGGTVRIESSIGKGTTFFVELPHQLPADPVSTDPTQP